MSALSLRQESVLDGEFDVEQVYVFRLQQLQKTFCLFLAQYETHFHRQVRGKFKKSFFMQYSVPPETGKLLAWNNLSPDGTPNPATLHQGMKVRRGTKYILTQWFRERPLS